MTRMNCPYLIIFESWSLDDLCDAENDETQGDQDDHEGDQEWQEAHWGQGWHYTMYGVWQSSVAEHYTRLMWSVVMFPCLDWCPGRGRSSSPTPGSSTGSRPRVRGTSHWPQTAPNRLIKSTLSGSNQAFIEVFIERMSVFMMRVFPSSLHSWL